ITHGSIFAPHLKQFSKALSSLVDQEYSLKKFANGADDKLKENLDMIKKLDKWSDNIKITSRNSKLAEEAPQDKYTDEEKKQLDSIIQSHNQN
ncbi:MAG: hypothetical protein ACE5EK_04890, partial [Nitrospinales bacterium]